MNPRNREICDFLKKHAGKTGASVADVATGCQISERSARGRIRVLLNDAFLVRVAGSCPPAYQWSGKCLPCSELPEKALRQQALRDASRSQCSAILHTAVVMDRMVRSGLNH
ncbi:GP62 [Burkholderia ambifaria IOP40-10]|uniref:GP62 n=1 Tax=Burkholderia ambifaria IOP40-10 TaxID=396596 RepID=B1FP04_9BURK|nr:hypothetical protein [Burkholderia ambifaria]EDT00729.1 GP62 [Burkholderia ambifaria IOP40-10]